MWVISQVRQFPSTYIYIYLILKQLISSFTNCAQALWLHQAFQLEFLGVSTFVPGLWLASLLFYLVNCWILGVIITDVGKGGAGTSLETKKRV
jgi:hypothetical protein